MNSQKLFLILAVLVVAWGALAFGAVYPWAYWPLLVASAATGLLGMFMPGPRGARIDWPVALGLATIGLAVIAQLIPLPRSTMLLISPETDAYLRQADVAYALRLSMGQSVWHSLSIRPDRTLLGLAFVVSLGLLLLGSARAFTVVPPERFTRALVALGVVLALVGIVQSGLMADRPYGFWEPLHAGGQAFGPFVNRNHFAGWMLLALPLAIGHFGALVTRGMPGIRPGWRNRIAWFSTPAGSEGVLTGFCVVVIALSLVMTLSRSGLVCFLVTVTLLAGRWLRQHATMTGKALGAAYASAVLITAVGWTGVDALGARLERVRSEDFGGRLAAWSDAADIARAFPMTGTGLNTYGFATLVYQDPALAKHYIEAHNDYLQLAAEGGVLLAVPVLAWLGVVTWQIARPRLARTSAQWLRAGAIAGIVAIGLQEAVDFSLQIPGNAALFTVLLGLALAYRQTGNGYPRYHQRPQQAGATT